MARAEVLITADIVPELSRSAQRGAVVLIEGTTAQGELKDNFVTATNQGARAFRSVVTASVDNPARLSSSKLSDVQRLFEGTGVLVAGTRRRGFYLVPGKRARVSLVDGDFVSSYFDPSSSATDNDTSAGELASSPDRLGDFIDGLDPKQRNDVALWTGHLRMQTQRASRSLSLGDAPPELWRAMTTVQTLRLDGSTLDFHLKAIVTAEMKEQKRRGIKAAEGAAGTGRSSSPRALRGDQQRAEFSVSGASSTEPQAALLPAENAEFRQGPTARPEPGIIVSLAAKARNPALLAFDALVAQVTENTGDTDLAGHARIMEDYYRRVAENENLPPEQRKRVRLADVMPSLQPLVAAKVKIEGKKVPLHIVLQEAVKQQLADNAANQQLEQPVDDIFAATAALESVPEKAVEESALIPDAQAEVGTELDDRGMPKTENVDDGPQPGGGTLFVPITWTPDTHTSQPPRTSATAALVKDGSEPVRTGLLAQVSPAEQAHAGEIARVLREARSIANRNGGILTYSALERAGLLTEEVTELFDGGEETLLQKLGVRKPGGAGRSPTGVAGGTARSDVRKPAVSTASPKEDEGESGPQRALQAIAEGKWYEAGNCHQKKEDPAKFVAYDMPPERVEAAKKVCRGCLVRGHCEENGIRTKSVGVWGELSHEELLSARRRAIRSGTTDAQRATLLTEYFRVLKESDITRLQAMVRQSRQNTF